ncbi:MAG: response regulator [Bacilli bacterium]
MIGSGKKIIFIDDNTIIHNMMRKKLEAFGFDTVDIGDSATYLFDKIKNGNVYDLILLDDMMPNMSGTEAMKILKAKMQHEVYNGPKYENPIIVFTSNESPADKDKYLEAGFDEYLGKGEISELENIIKKAVQ